MRFHIVGIGGAGMSAVARLLMPHGEVSGSDQGRWPLSEGLRALGATVHDTFDASHVEGADVVVRSSAYKEDNVEVAAALARGMTVWKRHDAWRFLAKGKRVVAIAGTHGKTTTTAMTWHALRGAGIDASLICGAALAETRTNAHVGASDVLVIEADEYDRVFQALEPEVAVVMNVDHDHVDHFPTREDYVDAFRLFVGGIREGGALVACADDPGSSALAADVSGGLRILTYGMSDSATHRVSSVTDPHDLPNTFKVAERERLRSSRMTAALRVEGWHNALNGAAALLAAISMGAQPEAAVLGLEQFAGTARRLERLGAVGGVIVIDDYAHLPVEIRAAVAAVSGGGRRVLAVFQPHTAARLEAFFEEFVDALRGAGVAIVVETFASARRDTDTKGASRELAARSGAAYARDPEEAARFLAELVQPGDTALIMGAGDIRAAGERLLQLLREREGFTPDSSPARPPASAL